MVMGCMGVSCSSSCISAHRRQFLERPAEVAWGETSRACGLMEMMPHGAGGRADEAPFSGMASCSLTSCSLEYRMRSRNLARLVSTSSAGNHLERATACGCGRRRLHRMPHKQAHVPRQDSQLIGPALAVC